MTNREYIEKLLNKFNISSDDIDVLLVNQQLDGAQQLQLSSVKLAVYREFTQLLPFADVSEGGFSIKWNLTALKMWYSALARELGQEDVLSSDLAGDNVNDRSYLF